MKRRGFFGALLGAAATPFAAKLAEAMPEEVAPVAEPEVAPRYTTPPRAVERFDEWASFTAASYTSCMPFDVRETFQVSQRKFACSYCGCVREGGGNCPGCGAGRA